MKVIMTGGGTGGHIYPAIAIADEIKKRFLIVPTTTRTREQYERIFLGIGLIKYALVCNGGVLLVDGKVDEEWYKVSKNLISNSVDELLKAVLYLESEELRKFEVRFIEELFVFTKCDKPERTAKAKNQSVP